MHETAEVFGEAGLRLRGMLHRPEVQVYSRGMVMCAPFGEERKSAARVMTLAARAFCREGFYVLRFDYRGSGESDGCLGAVTPQQWTEDIRNAIRHLAVRTGVTQVGLLGIRFGAGLAAMVPTDGTPLPFLIAWAPL